MKRSAILDVIAGLLGVFDVDWDTDIPDDGYTDIWGRADAGPLFLSDIPERPAITLAAPEPQPQTACLRHA